MYNYPYTVLKESFPYYPNFFSFVFPQFPIQEDTQFCQILQESLDFFGIPENDHKSYFLVDYKTSKFIIIRIFCSKKQNEGKY